MCAFTVALLHFYALYFCATVLLSTIFTQIRRDSASRSIKYLRTASPSSTTSDSVLVTLFYASLPLYRATGDFLNEQDAERKNTNLGQSSPRIFPLDAPRP